jgi:hypothetical protein
VGGVGFAARAVTAAKHVGPWNSGTGTQGTWIWTLMIARTHDSLLRWLAFDVH